MYVNKVEWRPLQILAQSACPVLAQLVCLHACLSLARFEKSGLWVDAAHKYVFGLSCVVPLLSALPRSPEPYAPLARQSFMSTGCNFLGYIHRKLDKRRIGTGFVLLQVHAAGGLLHQWQKVDSGLQR